MIKTMTERAEAFKTEVMVLRNSVCGYTDKNYNFLTGGIDLLLKADKDIYGNRWLQDLLTRSFRIVNAEFGNIIDEYDFSKESDILYFNFIHENMNKVLDLVIRLAKLQVYS